MPITFPRFCGMPRLNQKVMSSKVTNNAQFQATWFIDPFRRFFNEVERSDRRNRSLPGTNWTDVWIGTILAA